MTNVIHMAPSINNEHFDNLRGKSQQNFAQALLLKLNPKKSGDIAAILELNNCDNDLDAIVRWLALNQHRFASPLDVCQCYESLCYELNELIGPY